MLRVRWTIYVRRDEEALLLQVTDMALADELCSRLFSLGLLLLVSVQVNLVCGQQGTSVGAAQLLVLKILIATIIVVLCFPALSLSQLVSPWNCVE